MITKVLLVGMMGSGKSTVGTALASRLGWPYLDNDSLLERTAGSTAREIEQSQGGEALRDAELRALTLMLGMPGPLVGGVAGGVVLDDGARERIKAAGALVVWLRTSVPVLARRVGNGDRARLG
ncbi:MAG: shikimate kinase, partial [Mycobacteriales bacterium]